MKRLTRASHSKGHCNTATTSEGENEEVRPNRKRPAPSSSSTQLDCSGTLTIERSSDLDTLGFLCSICMEDLKEPTITFCGHTYCRICILATIDTTSRCPKCGTHITKDKLCPNFALSDVIARNRRSNPKSVQAEVLEATSSSICSSPSPPNDIVKLLTSNNYDNLNLNDLDRLLLVLNRRREIVASDDEEYKRKLMHEFLGQLLKVKKSDLEQLNREISIINKDMHVLGTCFIGGSDAGLASTKVETCPSSSSGIGFYTQPLHNVEMEQQSLAARKKRMYNHFDELSEIYFDTRKSAVFDATVPNSQVDEEEFEKLNNFGRTLSHVTQYHGFKSLATLSYSADMLSNSNVVSSIEFDKDNEFFAIAGVTKKIKVFEYINVIGSAVDIHCPSAELSCNAKISCVAWNSYFKNNLASSDYDGCVSLWDVASCTKVRSLSEHEKRVWSVDWSNGDPRLLASGSDDYKVMLWSTNSERSIANLEATANVCSVKFCPESAYVIAFGCADHCVHYYDFRNPREPLGVFYGHKKAVSYVKFASKDELVSASTDSHLKLWNLDESMSCVRSFQGHINEKNFVGLDTDGNYIACGSENNSLYLYHKSLPKPLCSFKFENHRSMLEKPEPDESSEFVSAVAWKKGSPVVVAANSQGAIQILELV
ncbi:E3 ubiquitin-protein ligase RFWD2 [Orchesella cincta]|uniref:E3 ubiquitin-protein ligase RFWD2 n=1 Tax=Orchesella cincta TaxID=48709 RepID=A0A1D2NMJ0_ORCCI|nr:E3 ubiquitin-protein ligase RFWD2 [Orchesella cincta]